MTCPTCRREVGDICLRREFTRCGCIDCHDCAPLAGEETAAAERENVITKGLAAVAELEAFYADMGLDPDCAPMAALRQIREAGREPYAQREKGAAG
jgi:hypothetical protein